MSENRDSKRAAVYATEQEIRRLLDRSAAGDGTVDFYGSTLTVPVERKFGDLSSIQRYVDLVLGLDWVTSRYPSLPSVKVRERAGNTKAHYEGATATIAIPLDVVWSRVESVLFFGHLTPVYATPPEKTDIGGVTGDRWLTAHSGGKPAALLNGRGQR